MERAPSAEERDASFRRALDAAAVHIGALSAAPRAHKLALDLGPALAALVTLRAAVERLDAWDPGRYAAAVCADVLEREVRVSRAGG